MSAIYTILATTPAGASYRVQVGQFDDWDNFVDRLKEEVWRERHQPDPNEDLDLADLDLEDFDIDLFDLEVVLVDDKDCDLGFTGTKVTEDSPLWEFLGLDDEDADLVIYYCEAHGYDFDEVTLSDIREAYVGTYADEASFAEQFADDIGAVDLSNARWIVVDWQATWDQSLSHDYIAVDTHDHEVAIFSRH